MAGVNEEIDEEVFLLDKQFDEELVEAAVCVPINETGIVAVDVVAEVGKLHARAAVLAAALALHAAGEDFCA